MSKIYVFGIGGTGSRVLRTVTMLLAAGVECKANTIVPIIIDPDAASGDVERTVTLMKHYEEIHNKLNFDSSKKNHFFKTEIKQILENFRLPLNNTQDELFSDYMNVSEMNKENKALANMLFSQENLTSDMTVGFKGNPNVGSVVLNQFDDSEQFLNFTNEFTAQDKIFIISSIFGGTGASGFPLLLKTLRTSESIANKDLVHNAHIGSITVLPYFQVKQDETSQINSATFVSKAKSALAYYERNISKNKKNGIDTLYYVADDIRTTYDNHEGGTEQKNNAHFIELISALALIDFANSEKKESTTHKEFGIKVNVNEIIFENLGTQSRNILRKPLSQFLLFSKFIDENETTAFLEKTWAKDHDLDRTYFKGNFMNTLQQIQKEFLQWLHELSTQQRKFTPFELHKDSSKVFSIIKGENPKRLITLDSNYNLFNNRINTFNKKVTRGDKQQEFIELLYLSTQQLLKEKFNIE